MKNIILIAPPAAGKGTLAEELVERDGYVQISTGNMLKEMAKQDQELADYLKTGKLVNDKMILDILKQKLSSLNGQHFILDGFPRTVAQAVSYEELANEMDLDIGLVIYLNVPEKELVKRITTRRVCSSCGKSYSTITEPLKPKNEGICDTCNGKLIQRTDDNEETFRVRLEEYKEKTSPLIQYYKYRDLLTEITSVDAEDTYSLVKKMI